MNNLNIAQHLGQVRFGLYKRLAATGYPVTSVTVDEFTEQTLTDSRAWVRENENRSLQFLSSHEERFLGKCRADILRKWRTIDPTLRGFAPNRFAFDRLLAELRSLSVNCCRQYFIGLREFYARQLIK